MTTILKDGQTTLDPRLDRLVEFDPASREYPIRALLPPAKPRSYTWRCPAWLDQGREGACVGFAWAHEVAARPVPRPADEVTAMGLYRRAQLLDQWPGENYSGSSVLAGAKAAKEFGYITEFRWALGGLEDLILAIGYKGPAVMGLEWREGMIRTLPNGMIHATGDVVGGHAILCNGVDVKRRLFRMRNSWSINWGISGDCLISFDDMDALLHAQGEACIPVVRAR